MKLLVGRQEEHTACENWVMMCWSEVHTICIRSRWCHCHPIITCFNISPTHLNERRNWKATSSLPDSSIVYISGNDEIMLVIYNVCYTLPVKMVYFCIFTRRRNYSFAEYWKHFVARLNGVHAFGYNSAGSEWISMKFGALRVYCLEQAPTDFGRDPRRSESGGSEPKFFCPVNAARLYRFLVSQISQNSHTRRGSVSPWNLSENSFWKFACRGFFQWLQTSGCDIYKMITNRERLRWVGEPTEFWLSICTVGINSKWLPWPVERAHR